MDLPEIRLIRRALKHQRLDPVVALGVLVKVLMDDHIDNSPHAREQYLNEEEALLEAGDFTSLPSPTTLLEGVLDLVKRQIDCKGQQLPAVNSPAGEDDAAPSAATRVTEDIYVALDELHEVLANALDTADKIYDVQSERPIGEV